MLTNELEGVNKDVYKTDWQWQEGEYTVTRTNMWTAPGCHNGCSVLYYTKDGKVEKIEGDPLSPYNQGRLCMRCLDVVETFYHPDRLKYPLKRVGERGENKWERITWDEAYDDIAEHVRAIWEEYGPESIVSMQGTGRNICWQTPYLSYATCPVRPSATASWATSSWPTARSTSRSASPIRSTCSRTTCSSAATTL